AQAQLHVGRDLAQVEAVAGEKFQPGHLQVRLLLAGGHLTGKEMAEVLTKSLGEEVTYDPLSFDAYRGLGFPGADDVGNMFQFKHDFEKDFCGARSLEFSKSLNPSLKSFDEWLKENASKIPLGN
ncbi:MAG: hypothetical protein R6W68_04385, partial [Ignavibacteriaceae bacterium]